MLFRKKSSEKLADRAEQTSTSDGAEVQHPKFDPEAAKRRIAEYKATHPDAVEDVDKAYTMATAEDPYRTIAVNARAAAKTAFKQATKSDKLANDLKLVNTNNKSLGIWDMQSDAQDQAEKNLRRKAENYEKVAIDFETKASENDTIAEQKGRVAGIVYDTERLDSKAAEEAKRNRIANYKAIHPNAVEDAEKAYAMAIAEDPYRTTAREYREKGKQNFKDSRAAYGAAIGSAYGLDGLKKAEVEAKRYDDMADEKGREAGKTYDTERLDPKAEEEAMRNRIANYKAAHPDAVEDVEKARFMAETGDAEETMAAELKRAAARSFRESNNREFQEKVGGLSPQEIREDSQKFLDSAKRHRAEAHKAEEEAGLFYDQMKDV